MSCYWEPGAAQRGEAQAVAPDLALVKYEMDAEEYAMSQHGQEQAPLPDLSTVKHEDEIDIEEHDLLQHPRVRAALQSRRGGGLGAAPPFDAASQPGSSARLELFALKVKADAQDLGAVQGAEPLSVSPELLFESKPFESISESQTQAASSHSAIVGGIRIKIEKDSILNESGKLFSSTVVIRDCAAELQQSGRYCQECRVQFSSCSALAEHDRLSSMPLVQAINETIKYKCKLCNYTCDTKFSFKRHIMTTHTSHTPYKTYKCSECPYSNNNRGALEVHMRTHRGEKSYKCDLCRYSFTCKSSLVRHKMSHTGRKPYNCDQCQFSSAFKNVLINHTRTHTGEKPYKCDQCQFSSAMKHGLVIHTRTHTGEKPYKCDQCEYRTASRCSFNYHKMTHTYISTLTRNLNDFTCDKCQYSCKERADFLRHIKTHEKSFCCGCADEGPGCYPARPPVTKTYSRPARNLVGTP